MIIHRKPLSSTLSLKKKISTFLLWPQETHHGTASLYPCPAHPIPSSWSQFWETRMQSQVRRKLAPQSQNKSLDLSLCKKEGARTLTCCHFTLHWVLGKISKITLAKHSQFARRKTLCKRNAWLVVISLLLNSEPEYKSQLWRGTNSQPSLGHPNIHRSAWATVLTLPFHWRVKGGRVLERKCLASQGERKRRPGAGIKEKRGQKGGWERPVRARLIRSMPHGSLRRPGCSVWCTGCFRSCEIFHLSVCHFRPPRITLTHRNGTPAPCWGRTG